MVSNDYSLHWAGFIWDLPGYSFKSNEFGLAIDNIVAFELVLPNGTVAMVTAEDHDLWFALRVTGPGISYRISLAEFRCRVVGITLSVAQGSLIFGG